jgi:tRNA A-37 threonylcarbamoyl transferase component Bud32
VTQQTDRLNTALAGRYRIERQRGEGGMAMVYLCEDIKHKRKVALKLLKPELAAVLGAERFVQEITTTAALQHPHILPLFDSGTADGFLFYVMPLIEGETLREKLNRETQLSVDEAVRITREVADALAYAHQHGIVHRDVKPENILLYGGHAMVADFGIALAVSAAAGGRMTETGLSLGTPHYMSPEQATAEKEITARSDIYSIGSVLYEMLTGNPPFTGAVAQQVIMKIITEPADAVTKYRKSVPANVAAALAKSLEKLPADRFESAKAFGEALANPAFTYASGAAPGAGAGGVTPNERRWKRLAVATSTLAAVLFGTAVWHTLRPAPPAVVSRDRIVLWDTPQLPSGSVGRRLAISPDGGTVVFVDGIGPAAQLYAKERDRLDATVLAGTAGVQGAPTFSPDGAWIAFVSSDGKVKKVPRLGGSAIAVADSAHTSFPAVAWLDGGTILYVDRNNGLMAVGQEGGASRRLFAVAADSTARNIRNVTSLPGGKAALVVVCSALCISSDLRVLDLKSSPPNPTMLVDQVNAGWPLPGGVVAFVRRDGGVLAAPFDVASLKFTRTPTPVLDGVRSNGATADIATSANGTVIYVPGVASSTPSVSVEPIWVTRTGVTTPIDTAWTVGVPSSGTGVADKRLALSPDGHRLALSILRAGSGFEHDIWIKQLDHAPLTLTRLTFEGNNAAPAWTQDGRVVVFASRASMQPGSVRRRRADGTGAEDTLVNLKRGINDVVLTRDTAQFVLGLAGAPSLDIVRARRGDSAVTPLVASSAFNERAPALSPDGRWLAYASNESGRFEVYARTFPDVTGARWQVSQDGGIAPVWSHSGRELFYQNGARALIAAAVLPGPTFTLGAQSKLFDASGFAGVANALFYDVAPDDKRFVFLRPVGRIRRARTSSCR